ncbi:30S ribosomal protein S1 [Halothiobacillus sp. DCM-1]|uniref:30S ribosomal protein S1 n=1 Tax=Halothiobacillus sp. DCM-1 TaxID=3112558 RepID=UPI0032544091
MSTVIESFADLFEESLKNAEMQTGSIIEGTVVAINNDVVVIDTGLKSEGVIPAAEFLDENGQMTVKVGDKVDVALESVEDGFGETKLSREKALRARAWTALEKSFKNEEIVTGRITGKVKGGFTVEMGEIRAFLPGSLVDVRPIRDTTYLEGKDVEFKIIKLDQKRNNVVVSRRAVVEQEYSAERDALLDQLQEGMVLRGVVKNLTDYGAFLDLGGIDGLLHITDMAWKRVKHPSEVVNIGDEVDVKVLKFDRERNRVSLGMKQMGDDPWSDLARRFPISSRMFGKVTNLTDYGCFVEIDNGVEGLVHVSEMDWTNKNVNPGKVVSVGDEVEVMILDIDEERRRISLGMKQCQANPWDAFAATHQKGDKVSGQIKSITDFGVFIGLEGGIDGLIHLSDLSWSEPGEEAVRQFKKGEEIEAVVIAIDPERERISLGLKQLESDPVGQYSNDTQKGKIVTGTVREVDARGAVIDLGNGVEGYLRASDISRDRIDDARTVLNAGDSIEAKVMGIDRKNRMVSLSIRAKDSQEESEAMEELSRNTVSAPTLGDLLKEQMNRGE